MLASDYSQFPPVGQEPEAAKAARHLHQPPWDLRYRVKGNVLSPFHPRRVCRRSFRGNFYG